MINFKLIISAAAMTAFWLPTAASAQVGPPPSSGPYVPSFSYEEMDLKRDVEDPTLITAPSPVMPDGAQNSGYCCVDFDIGTQGRAINTVTSYCSEPLFEVAAINAVERAEFTPAKIGGVRRMSEGHSFDVTFKKEDYEGNLKPSADGRMTASSIKNALPLCPY